MMIKARALKHLGDITAAHTTLEQARRMDLADRYVNTQAAKMQARIGGPEEALKIFSLFTRPEANVLDTVQDLQVLWFQLELGRSYERKKCLPNAIKWYSQVIKHCEDHYEDQFDFHQYCVRNGVITSYLQLLAWSNAVYREMKYVKATKGVCMSV